MRAPLALALAALLAACGVKNDPVSPAEARGAAAPAATAGPDPAAAPGATAEPDAGPPPPEPAGPRRERVYP